MGMMIRQDEATGILGEVRMALLRQCLDAAWAKFDSSFRPLIPLCSPVGMANTLRELVIQEVRERFLGVAGVTIHDRNVFGGRFLAEIDQKVILSFKKLTQGKKGFRTSNNPTPTSRAFDRQETHVADLPDLPRITVGYKLGFYGTAIEGVYLAFVVGKDCIWHHPLGAGAASIEIEFPRADTSAADKEREAAKRERVERKRRMRGQGTDGKIASDSSAKDDEVTDGG